VSLVLDSSVALTWCFEDEHTPATHDLLDQIVETGAMAPSLWPQVDNAERDGVSVLAPQHDHGTWLDLQAGSCLKRRRIVEPPPECVQDSDPWLPPALGGQRELQHLVAGIEDQVKAVVGGRNAAGIGVENGLAIDENPQRLGRPAIP